MRLRTVVIVTVLIALAHVLVGWGAWSARSASSASAPEPVGPTASATGYQRLAELYARAAFRAVNTSDDAGLTDLVARSASWPDVSYVVVQDRQGKVLAHRGDPGDAAADSAKTGPARPPSLREVVSPIRSGSDDGTIDSVIGSVRLGYLLPADSSRGAAVPPPSKPALPLAALLALAALAAVPVAVAVVKVAAGQEDEVHPGLDDVRTLRQAKVRLSGYLREVEAARESQDEARDQVDRLTLELDLCRRQFDLLRADLHGRAAPPRPIIDNGDDDREKLTEEMERISGELTRVSLEVDQRTKDLDQRTKDLEQRDTELAEVRDELARKSQETETLVGQLAGLRSDVDRARAALSRSIT